MSVIPALVETPAMAPDTTDNGSPVSSRLASAAPNALALTPAQYRSVATRLLKAAATRRDLTPTERLGWRGAVQWLRDRATEDEQQMERMQALADEAADAPRLRGRPVSVDPTNGHPYIPTPED